jgi:hypothetical protein
MARLVLPSGVATSFIDRHWDAGWFVRTFIGFCWVPTGTPPGWGAAGPDRFEVFVGHQNRYLPGSFCWEENDSVLRGAVRFPLTLRDVTAGFHEHEQAWLTWRKVDPDPFFGCTQALVTLGRAEFDWEVGGYFRNGSTAEKHNLKITGTGIQINDADAIVPRSATPRLRRVEVTDIVRDWVERGHPNFGFVLTGDESFKRVPTRVVGSGVGRPDIAWENCIGSYGGFELVFSPIGYNPSYGRAPADL